MSAVHCAPLTEGLLEGVLLVDPRSERIVEVNAAAARMAHSERGQMIGTNIRQWLPEPQDAVFWDEWQAGISQTLESHTSLRCADGALVRVHRRMGPIHPVDGQALVLVAMQDLDASEQDLRTLEVLLNELRAAFESAADGVLVCDLGGRIRAFNRAFAALWDLPQSLLAQPHDDALLAHMAACVADTAGYQARLHHLQLMPLLEAHDLIPLRTGRLLERISQPQLARGRPIGRVYIFRDITERTATEAKLRLAAEVFESSLDAIFITDAQRNILAYNPAAQRLAQLGPGDAQGQPVDALLQSAHNPLWAAERDRALEDRGYWECQLWLRREAQPSAPVWTSWTLLRDEHGHVLNTVVFAKDLSEKLQAQRRIEQLAYTDTLTGLPNRAMLGERVEHAIRLAQRSGTRFAVLFLDLDRFKSINDSLGHLFGDQVLVQVATRLQQCLRQTDTLARLGGDEFVAHLHDADERAAENVAQRMVDAVTQPVTIGEMSFTLSCSIGIALYPQDGTTLDDLIRCADTAMYQVKERGKGHFRFYQPQMNADLLARVQTDHALRDGLRRGEFELYYQPRMHLASGRVDGCEALIRWHRPGVGLVPPGAFIPIAEETGVIVALGDWVLNAALAQAARWIAQGRPLQVAINISALQFAQPRFVQNVAQALQRHGVAPRWLELELTESILIRDTEEAIGKLQALASLGVTLALDDFGTGFSSLAYLKRFALHRLKIDRTFVAATPEDQADAAIVAAIVQMGHALSMEVVAEGVERIEQLTYLRALGCDHCQGYWFAQPMPAASLEAFRDAAPGSDG
ncbi:MAG: EAL domain-containing protein [Tepidimonas sp.]|uniref:EAL domain-containing protein n=1 Tax=Tepidimonas sp. TaxID=2002775 RepID=UPI0040551663